MSENFNDLIGFFIPTNDEFDNVMYKLSNNKLLNFYDIIILYKLSLICFIIKGKDVKI